VADAEREVPAGLLVAPPARPRRGGPPSPLRDEERRSRLFDIAASLSQRDLESLRRDAIVTLIQVIAQRLTASADARESLHRDGERPAEPVLAAERGAPDAG
jgi:hypothetical protein